MEIKKVRLVNSNMSVAIDYIDESGQEHLLILGAENVVKHWQAVEQPLAPDGLKSWGNLGKCTICGKAWEDCSCLTSRW